MVPRTPVALQISLNKNYSVNRHFVFKEKESTPHETALILFLHSQW